MSAIAVKGWCPGAWRPMQSGDGLIVRIRPRCGRLSASQGAGIAELAERFGNGLIDLTNRANLQLRGVRVGGHTPLLQALAQLDLLDADAGAESRRNIIVAPFWSEHDETRSIAMQLERALSACHLDLPGKFGFAVDCGRERALAGASADIRIERCAMGNIIVRADGAAMGRPVARTEAVATALALAEWFVASGGVKNGRGRMAAHLGTGMRLPTALAASARPAPAMPPPRPGLFGGGALIGTAFGQLSAAALALLARRSAGLRITPWRMVLVEGLQEMPHFEGLVTAADDQRLAIDACSGRPVCPQAHADTRALATALAPHLGPGASLHVSGCAKGCAHPGISAITLVATDDGFDLIRNGIAGDRPLVHGLTREQLLADPSVLAGDF
jgi:precorrin-3B synthase